MTHVHKYGIIDNWPRIAANAAPGESAEILAMEKPKQIVEAQDPATRGTQLQSAKPETEKCQGAIGPSELPWDAAADTTFRFAVLGACFEAQQRVTGER